jgi:hypothetical protein
MCVGARDKKKLEKYFVCKCRSYYNLEGLSFEILQWDFEK